jgi:hypothetical protein
MCHISGASECVASGEASEAEGCIRGAQRWMEMELEVNRVSTHQR